MVRLQPKNTTLPSGIGNIRNARIDSAFFSKVKEMLLKVRGTKPLEYVIEFLRYEDPKPRRKYPYVEKSKSKEKLGTKPVSSWSDFEKSRHSDPSKAKSLHSRPREISLDQVSISRGGEYAHITYLDGLGGGMNLKVDGDLGLMTDKEIIKQHNEVVIVMKQVSQSYQHVPVEVPVGRPQITYHPRSCQWVPRGDVLRCLISDGGPDCEAVIIIDDQELSLQEFGRLLTTYAGWGMRITFVPDDEMHQRHLIEITDPKDND